MSVCRRATRAIAPLYVARRSCFVTSGLARSFSASALRMGGKFVGSIDNGTTSTRFIIFDEQANVIAVHSKEFTQRQCICIE